MATMAAPACMGARTVIGSCSIAIRLTQTREAPDKAAPTNVATKASVDRLPEAGRQSRQYRDAAEAEGEADHLDSLRSDHLGRQGPR